MYPRVSSVFVCVDTDHPRPSLLHLGDRTLKALCHSPVSVCVCVFVCVCLCVCVCVW